MEKTTYTKDWLVKEMAKKASFTQGDVRIILNALEEAIRDIVFNKDELILQGLFKLSVTTIKAHSGYNAFKNEAMEIPESHRIKLRASRALLDLLKVKK